MAYRTNNSSGTASGSQSPSSATSSNTSPASRTSQLSMGKEGDGQPVGNGRGTPNRARIDTPRSLTATKGGCWTCRLRRKKCDEQREEENGACETCRRLHIECLGWGSKRPEWMKDKKAQDEYKAKIKATLLSNNMIRGQPRPHTNTTSSSMTSNPVVPSQPYPSRSPPSASPRPRPSSSGMSSPSIDYEYRYADMHHSRQNTVVPPISGLLQRHSYHGEFQPNFETTAASSSQLYHQTTASYSDPNVATLDMNSLYPPATMSFATSTISPPETGNYDPFPLTVPTFTIDTQPQGVASSSSQNAVQQEHVLYYFEHVRKMQFIFAGSNLVTNIIYSIILEEPQGAVTNAVCALASLHSSRMQVAQFSDPNPEQNLAQFFYNEAWAHLANSKQTLGHYTESDAIAALHLVSYSLLSRGTTDWRYMLEVACEWLNQTGMTVDDDPKFTMSNMTSSRQFAVKATMWLDIISSMTLMKPPKFLALYRRLFGNNSDFWASSGHGHDDGYELRMDGLTGCPDDVMLAIAEVSALAHWKTQERQNGCLSVRELIRRGDAIEQQLRTHTEPESFAEVDQAPMHPSLPGTNIDYTNSTSVSKLSAPQAVDRTIQFPSEEMRRVVASLFRETVILYLHTVLSDPIPGVPEITSSVDAIIKLFSRLPPSELDRSLVFPLCLTGCMTDNRARRDLLRGRLQAQDESLGNILQARALMEAVWRRRDVGGGAVDWREIMHNDGLNLLLL